MSTKTRATSFDHQGVSTLHQDFTNADDLFEKPPDGSIVNPNGFVGYLSYKYGFVLILIYLNQHLTPENVSGFLRLKFPKEL